MKASVTETPAFRAAAPSSGGAAPRRGVRRETREITLIVAAIVVLLAVGAINHRFVSIENIRFMVLNSVVLSLLALGQTWVIATKGIDLSVAPVMGLTAVVTGLLAQSNGLPLIGAVGIALVIGLVLGTINGLLVARLTIPPIIVTLGTYSIYSGLIFIYSNGTQVDQVPAAYAAFGNGIISSWLPIPIPVLLLAAVLFLCWFTLGHTLFGRAVLAIGNNAVAAYNAGVSVMSTQIRVYVISGVLAALAGLVFVCYTGSATVTTGTGDHVELQSIAVALIGGTAIAGGRGNMIGTVLGGLFLSVILTALVFLHVPPIWYSAGEGAMILITVTLGMRQSGAGSASR
jgi:ribose/xylose/arabinose/galactoside ABC-type transport system permease subunit